MPEFRASVLMNDRVRHLDEFVKPTKAAVEEAVKVSGNVFRRQQSRLFASSGSSGGQKWKELSDRYARRKERLKPGRPILTFSGDMRDRFSKKSHNKHVSRGFKSAGQWIIRHGAISALAAFHGPGRLHNPKLPVRDPMQRTDRQALLILAAVRRGLVRKMDERSARIAAQAKRFFRVS